MRYTKLCTKGNGISCKIQHYKLWRRVLKERYPEAIVGKQRRNSSSGLKQSLDPGVKGVRFILRFRLKGVEDTYFKVGARHASDGLIDFALCLHQKYGHLFLNLHRQVYIAYTPASR